MLELRDLMRSRYTIPFLLTPSACYRVVPVDLFVDLVWPSNTLRGCLLHFKQAIIRHAYSIGLKAYYYTVGNPIRSAIQIFGALREYLSWEKLQSLATLTNLLSLLTLLSSSSTSHARYLPSQWNHYKAILSVICRSSNVV